MIRQKRKEQTKFLSHPNPKQFASELSSLQSPQVKAKPSKIAEKKFIRKLRVYRKNHKYLTEDENSQQSLREIRSCFEQQSDHQLQKLQFDFKRKLYPHDEPEVPEQSQGRKVLKKQNNFSGLEENSKQIQAILEQISKRSPTKQ